MNSDKALVWSSVMRLILALNIIYEENSIIVHKQESRPVQFFLKELVIADRLLKKALWFLSERLDLQISFIFSQAQTSPSWLKNLSISTLNRAMPTTACTLNYHFPFYLSANLFHSYSLWLSFVIFGAIVWNAALNSVVHWSLWVFGAQLMLTSCIFVDTNFITIGQLA